jgi:hypothetical protein
MKLITLALAAALASVSTFALAQSPGLGGYGSVVQPSVGSYSVPFGSSNAVPTWRNTGPAAPMPSAPTMGSAPGNRLVGTSHRTVGVAARARR